MESAIRGALALSSMVVSLAAVAGCGGGGGGEPLIGDGESSPTPSGDSLGGTDLGAGVVARASIVLERLPAVGACLDENQFREVSIVFDHSGVWMLSGTRHDGWDSESPGCQASPCARLTRLEPFALTREQTTSLERLMAKLSPSPACAGHISPVCDPCRWDRLTVDGTGFDGGACRTNTCKGYIEAFDAITARIDSFAR